MEVMNTQTSENTLQWEENASEWEKERGMLLSLGKNVAAVKHKNELLNVLTTYVKPILGFTFVAIYQLEQQTQQFFHSLSMLDIPDEITQDSRFIGALQERYTFEDLWIKAVTESSVPVSFNLSELVDHPAFPDCIKLVYEHGMVQVVVARLLRYGEVIGTFNLMFDTQHQFTQSSLNMIQGIADQISIAVSNIEAIEKLERREFEKSRLLSFGNTISFVKNKDELTEVFSHHIRALCGTVDYCLHWLSDDQQDHFPYLWNSHIIASAPAGIEKLIHGKFPVHDGIFNTIESLRQMVIVDIDQENLREDCPFYLRILKSKNVAKILGFPVFVRDKMTGIFFANYNEILEKEQHLVSSMCAQLAIAVSNLIATEKVNKQLQEINQYKEQLEEERIYLKEELQSTNNYGEMIGISPGLKTVFDQISQVVSSDSTVLLLGETGTGKELVARALHQNSPRKDKLMVKLNCAALPANLIESELFGHERGSFTGAVDRRIGKFELANGGSLFLDEIGELPLSLQAKLLRVLQEKEVDRIGGRTPIPVDVRIIAATNRDLKQEVEAGNFRSDLFYRLNIFPVLIPPLRDRKEDIPLLAAHFITRFAKKLGKSITSLNSKVLQELQEYSWPGNIRELEHLMERSVLISNGNSIKSVDLPSPANSVIHEITSRQQIKTIDENEREHILSTLKLCKGRIGGKNGAAKLLGVPATTLSSKIKKLGITRGFNI